MNGIEKAIETLKMENELMQFNPMTGEIKPIELQNQDNQDLYNANLIAISILEKQMPKKPINQSWYFECPNCKSKNVINEGRGYRFCNNCGQRLSWEVENE
jgi:hypothetical protein